MNHERPLTNVTKLERFRRWWPQIENAYCDLDKVPDSLSSPWERETYMRNVLWDAVKALVNDEDVLMTGEFSGVGPSFRVGIFRAGFSIGNWG